MSIIKIVANGMELDVVKDSLTIKKENNIFIPDFKVSHSTFPFLIIENEKTKRALGTRDMTSVLRTKTVPVTVFEMGERYYGELQILTYPTGLRKCNIKYGSDVLKIMDKKVGELLPVVSVIPGVTNPVPFTEEALEVTPGYLNWQGYPAQFAGKIYPEVNYQFPTMYWPKKFNDDTPETDDEWYFYQGNYNAFAKPSGSFKMNFYTIADQNVTIINTQVPSPQLFLLAVLEYCFATIGYKIAGDFVQSDFIRRILLLSTKTNLCKVMIAPEQQYFDFSNMVQIEQVLFYDQYIYSIPANAAGTYTFNYRVHEPLRPGGISYDEHRSLLRYGFDEDSPYIYYNANDPANLIFEGSFTIDVSQEQIGKNIVIAYYGHHNLQGTPVSFFISWSNNSKPFQLMHPTIALGRYTPDWTLSTFINEVKKKFCLDVRFDDLAKVAYFNFADKVITHPAKHIALKSLAVDDYTPPENIGFILKHGNDQDPFIYVDKIGVTVNLDKTEADFVETIESKFKLVTHNGTTADLSTMDDIDGTGLMVYNPDPDAEGFPFPLIAKSYNGRTLAFEGSLGIYNTCYRKVLQFRLNASTLEISGPFTETEISQINKLLKIYIDSQAYVITAMEYEPATQDKYQVKLELASINF